MCVHVCVRAAGSACSFNRSGSSRVCFGGLNIPHLLRREGGIKDEGTGKSMVEWNPAAIELFQLTLAEEKRGRKRRGDSKTFPARSLAPVLTAALLLPLHTHLSVFVSFSIFLLPRGKESFFIHETAPGVFSSSLLKSCLKM